MLRPLFIAALLLALPVASPVMAEPPPTFIANYYYSFNQVSQMALGPDANVYLADAYRNRIVVLNQAGGLVSIYTGAGLPLNGLGLPSGVAFDAAGNLYVAEQSKSRISKFAPGFVPLFTMGTPGSGPGQLNYPSNLAISPDGATIYVAELLNHRVSRFDPAGNFLGSFGGPSAGSGPGQFNHPFGIVVDAAGDVFVADQRNHRIQRFGPTGTYLGEWGVFGTGPGQFHFPVGLGLDAAGKFYVTDQLNNRVQKFHHDGSFILEWGTYGPADGQFYNPWCVLPIGVSRVWVGDTYNYRIGVFETLVTPAETQSWGSIKARYR